MKKKVEMPYVGKKGDGFVIGHPSDDYIDMNLYESNSENSLDAEVAFGGKTVGPPGHVHGGCQAAVLDEMMGSVSWYLGYQVVARNINVDFLVMMPLHKTYECSGRVVKKEGKKLFVEAELKNGATVFARSTGLFIELDAKKLEELKKKLDGKD